VFFSLLSLTASYRQSSFNCNCVDAGFYQNFTEI
jgi:hypothetical protein